jgi:hypothetical protein
MSLNMVAVWPLAIVAVSDRRVTDFVSKVIRTNRSTKMTVFGCADAHGAVVYNGIGVDDEGLTPSDWLMKLAETKLFESSLQEVLDGVKTDLEVRLQRLRARYGRKTARHTFVFGVWHEDHPKIFTLTNYESLDDGNDLVEGNDAVTQKSFVPSLDAPVKVVSTGMMPPKADLNAVSDTIKTKPAEYVVARCIKVVRDVAYRGGNPKGAVGAAAQWAIIGPGRDAVQCGLDVVGGRVAQEPPNIINIHARSPVAGTFSVGFGSPGGTGMLFKDAYVYAVAGDGSRVNIAQYDPVRKQPVFSEPKCGVCGSPWPASHRFCEVCLHDEHRAHGKKQRRNRKP